MINLINMNTGKYLLSLFSLLLWAAVDATGQEEIRLSNPSFESPYADALGRPECCLGAKGWYSCGRPDLNTPDAQPGNFGVELPAAGGSYYIGLVARDNDTWEAMSQRLRTPMQAGKCYSFSMKLSHSEDLVSQSRITQKNVLYNRPILVRVWGGNGYCSKLELLDETPPVDHTTWKEYTLRFEPKKTYSYILIEAFYKTPTPLPYNGNILMDDLSSIKMIACDEDEPPIVDVEPQVDPEPTPDPPAVVNVKPTKPKKEPKEDPIVSTQTPTPDPVETYNSEKSILNLDRKKMTEGEVIRIQKLSFQADSSTILPNAFPVLDEIYGFMRAHPEVSIEIGGHTNNRCQTSFCDQLSKLRAKAVAEYLVEKGIREDRLVFKGYGKRNPVATNATPTGRKRNQRVEIKILDLDG